MQNRFSVWYFGTLVLYRFCGFLASRLESGRLNYSPREIAVIFPLARNLIDNKVKIREY